MIISITSSLPDFKPLTFEPGLNILLADTTDAEATGNTRNSAGKSSFVQILDFLLGASAGKDSLFRADELVEAVFTGCFRIAGREITVSRTGSQPSRLFLEDSTGLPKNMVKSDGETKQSYISNADWCRYLGNVWFGLPLEKNSGDFARKSAPTYRSIIKYFLRLDGDGGFSHPEKNSANQQKSSYQVCLSYMFGLEWRIAQEFQKIRKREKTLETLRKWTA
jgi:uncharacterized protein YydD (DUF2326 family)